MSSMMLTDTVAPLVEMPRGGRGMLTVDTHSSWLLDFWTKGGKIISELIIIYHIRLYETCNIKPALSIKRANEDQLYQNTLVFSLW